MLAALKYLKVIEVNRQSYLTKVKADLALHMKRICIYSLLKNKCEYFWF